MVRARPGACRALVEEGPTRVSALASYFKFSERGTNMWTEARGGLTTFMVMVYIVFLNSSILGDGFGLAADDPGRIALSAASAPRSGLPKAFAHSA